MSTVSMGGGSEESQQRGTKNKMAKTYHRGIADGPLRKTKLNGAKSNYRLLT